MKLPEPVKRFIELNIDLIEQDKWYEVFVNWYTNGNDYYIFEFFDALDKAGINIYEFADTRKKIIEEMSKYVFEDKLKSSNKVTKSYLEGSLASYLGLPYDAIVKIFDKVANDMQLTEAKDGWYRL